MPDLVLGPPLRYTSEADATVWFETDAACEVEVLDCSSLTSLASPENPSPGA
jgi:hypothetical protein